MNKNYLSNAAEHMKVFELLRKEYRYSLMIVTHLKSSIINYYAITETKMSSNYRFVGSESNDEDIYNEYVSS